MGLLEELGKNRSKSAERNAEKIRTYFSEVLGVPYEELRSMFDDPQVTTPKKAKLQKLPFPAHYYSALVVGVEQL